MEYHHPTQWAMLMLCNDVHIAAQAIALQEEHRVLILTGKLDGHNGLPQSVAHMGEGLKLKMMLKYTRFIPTGVFEVLDEDALCAVIDTLQACGGYKAVVINHDGSSDPSYIL